MPRDLKPYFYELLIKPYFNATESPEFYNGNVLVKFTCHKSTNKIVLHTHENLELFNNTFELSSQSDASLRTPLRGNLNWNFVVKTQFLIIDLSRNNVLLSENHNYSLSIGFKGLLKDDNAGFYKSSYLDDHGKKRLEFFFRFRSN